MPRRYSDDSGNGVIAAWELRICGVAEGVPSERCGRIILTRDREVTMARAGEDPKVEALRAERSLNPRPEAVSDERFASSEFLDARDLVQVKYEMVRRARVDGEPVSRTAEAFGFSRPSFYAAQAALDEGGLAALVPARPGPRGAHKLTGEVVAFARERLAADPRLSSQALAELIAEHFGVRVHRRSVERALARAEPAEREERGEESEDD
jgi:transposase